MTVEEIKKFGLLYSKDPDGTFPLTEIGRAVSSFGRRRDFAGLTPSVVHINPAHQTIVEMAKVEAMGLVVVFNEKVSQNYVWLQGRLANGNGNKNGSK